MDSSPLKHLNLHPQQIHVHPMSKHVFIRAPIQPKKQVVVWLREPHQLGAAAPRFHEQAGGT